LRNVSTCSPELVKTEAASLTATASELRPYSDIEICVLLLFFMPTSTKPQAEISELNRVNGCNDISFGIIAFWKETAFPRWRAMDRRWKRNSVEEQSYNNNNYYYYYYTETVEFIG